MEEEELLDCIRSAYAPHTLLIRYSYATDTQEVRDVMSGAGRAEDLLDCIRSAYAPHTLLIRY